MADRKGLVSLLFTLKADIGEFQTELRKAQREMVKWGKDMQKTGQNFSRYLTLPIAAFATGSVMAFRSVNESMKQIQAGLESTGGAAGFTSDELRKMANELMIATNTLNTDILGDVTAQLLTFTSVSGEVFEKAQMAVLDLSSRMKTDLRSSAIQVGKALNDPIQGLTALRRVGIQFTKDQEDVIRAMVDTGDVVGAQKIILAELERQFGGSAEAAGDSIDAMTNSIKVMGQEFGGIIMKFLTPFFQMISGLVQKFGELSDRTKTVIVVIGGLAAAIGPVMIAIGFMAKSVIPMFLGGLFAIRSAIVSLTAAMMANPFIALAAVAAAAAAALLIFRKGTKDAEDAQWKLGDAIKDTNIAIGEQIYNTLADGYEVMADGSLKAIGSIDKLKDSLTQLTRGELESLKLYLNTLIPEAQRDLENSTNELTKIIIQQDISKYIMALEAVEKELGKFKTSTDDATGALGKQKGILELLSEEMKILNDLREKATSREDIAVINDRVEALNKEKKTLENLTEAYIKLQAQILQQKPVSIQRNESFSLDVDPGPGLMPFARGNQEAVNNIISQFENLKQHTQDLNAVFSQAFTDIAFVAADGLGQMLAGTMTFAQVLTNIVGTVADAMQQLGRLYLANGIAAQFFVKSIANPIAAITSGLALIAAGAAVKGFIAKPNIPGMMTGGIVPEGFPNDTYLARLTSGETVIPRPKALPQSGLFNQMQNLKIVVEGRTKGRDIHYSGQYAAKNISKITG